MQGTRVVTAGGVVVGASDVRVEEDQLVLLICGSAAIVQGFCWGFEQTAEVVGLSGFATDQTDEARQFHEALDGRVVFWRHVFHSESVSDDHEH